MAVLSKQLLKWRRKKKPGSLMKPKTFAGIVASEEAKGLSPERAKKAAGRAYWNAVKSKYKGRKK